MLAVFIACAFWFSSLPAEGCNVPAEGCNVPAERIVSELLRMHRLSGGHIIRYEQNVHMKVGPLRWAFHTAVEQKGVSLHVTVQKPPWFLPGRVTSTLAAPASLLTGYNITGVVSKNTAGTQVCVLQGKRKAGTRLGAASISLWVEPNSWLVRKAVADYWWGQLESNFQYDIELGRTVVRTQSVMVQQLGVVMSMKYGKYRFSD